MHVFIPIGSGQFFKLQDGVYKKCAIQLICVNTFWFFFNIFLSQFIPWLHHSRRRKRKEHHLSGSDSEKTGSRTQWSPEKKQSAPFPKYPFEYTEPGNFQRWCMAEIQDQKHFGKFRLAHRIRSSSYQNFWVLRISGRRTLQKGNDWDFISSEFQRDSKQRIFDSGQSELWRRKRILFSSSVRNFHNRKSSSMGEEFLYSAGFSRKLSLWNISGHYGSHGILQSVHFSFHWRICIFILYFIYNMFYNYAGGQKRIYVCNFSSGLSCDFE